MGVEFSKIKLRTNFASAKLFTKSVQWIVGDSKVPVIKTYKVENLMTTSLWTKKG